MASTGHIILGMSDLIADKNNIKYYNNSALHRKLHGQKLMKER